MKVKIYGKNITVTQAIADKVEKKLSFLDKYFIIDEEVVANVMVRVYRQSQKIEVTIPTKIALLRAEAQHEDLYAAIDLVVDKLEDQIRRQKTRLSKKNKDKLASAFMAQEDASEEQLVKTKTIYPTEMDLDEAILQMEMLGHDFFVYLDDETKEVAVVYRRLNGGYGLIETQK